VLLTITNSTRPATDLGYLLHKHPDHVRSVKLAFGDAHVFYPEADEDRCTAALLLDVDPISLVRRGRRSEFALAEYVNDRPYVASSFMSVAIARAFGTALGGRSGERPQLVETPLELSVHLPVLPCRGGEPLLRRLFEPLGYAVSAVPIPLDTQFPAWGESRHLDVKFRAETRLRDLLGHLYVMLPVLDDQKHYWVARDEIDKLLLRGREWLATHPERELITRRYLRHQPRLAREALARLLEEDQPDPDAAAFAHGREEEAIEERLSLRDQRLGSVVSALKASGARRVLDLGCGDGRLLRALLKERDIDEVVGVEVSVGILETAARRLRMEEMAPKQRQRIRLLQSSLTYRDRRLYGYDAAVLMEVVEHIDPERLGAMERSVFREATPRTVVVTTPNTEYNVRFDGLAAGSLRHRDHRFEWTRAEFREWAGAVADRNGYAVRFLPVGPDPEVGPPTQMALFSK
jgi:3' terminal RNA ribose 2'-O-methyltransferase Hen1